MPHVAFVPFTGLRIREQDMLALGMSLPGLRHRAAAVTELPALGLLTLAGLTPPHWSCGYYETDRHGGDSLEELAETVVESHPDLVAISALTASVDEAYRFSQLIRQRGIPVVLGGLHATACPEEALRHCDVVVAGDGEPVWRQLLDDVENHCAQPFYRASRSFDLHLSPTPRFDLLGTKARPRFTLQTQRGCPLACEFCGASRLLGTYREKPCGNVERELAAIGERTPHPILELADDNTFVARPDGAQLLETLAASGARYFTEADWRLGERTDLLPRLARSGCVQVLVGIESLVFRHPGMGNKQAELTRIMDAVDAIQEAGVAVIGCFIVGSDGETRASLDRLVEFILGSRLADVQLTLQTPFPGTALHRRLRRQRRLLADRGWSHYTLFDVTYRPDVLDVAELETAFRELVREVFGPVAAARRAQIRRPIHRTFVSSRPPSRNLLPTADIA